MEKYSIEKTTLVGIGDAIRQKKGITGPIPVTQMKPEIESILVNGIDTSDATAAAGDIMKDKTAYVKGQKVTGTKVDPPVVDTAAPTITVSANGLIAAENKQDPGVVEGGTKRTTKQLPTQSAQNITPGTNDVTIPSGFYLTGTQTIKGDANLVPGNIRKNATIFGIAGGYEGIDTSDATAAANDIASGKTAYVKGEKVTGNVEVIDGTENISNAATTWVSGDNGGLSVTYTPNQKVMLESDASIVQIIKKSKFGDAQDSDVTQGKTYTSTNGLKRTGTKVNPTSVTRGTPSISVSDDGLITASVAQAAGLVDAGTNSNTKQLTTNAGGHWLPRYSDTDDFSMVCEKGQYMTGDMYVFNDKNLLPENIKAGVEIFGILGAFSSSKEITAIKTGTVTNTSDKTGTQYLMHSMGVTPNLFILYYDGDVNASDFSNVTFLVAYIGKEHKTGSTEYLGHQTYHYGNSSGSFAYSGYRVTTDWYIGPDLFQFNVNTTKIKAGLTYNWIAARIEGLE